MLVLRQGRTWVFSHPPAIFVTATVGGPREKEGPLGRVLDRAYEDPYVGEKTFERAERALLESAVAIALRKGSLAPGDIDLFVGGDLLNQIVSTAYTARSLGVPYLGLYSACATSTGGLALAALLVASGAAGTVLTGAVSHNLAAERQFRQPTEYGGQKPPTAQTTVTGAGVAVVRPTGLPVRIRAATVGRVVDMGITDAMNMGAAMAPAAVDTLRSHLADVGLSPGDYDLIVTGDLGEVGRKIFLDLMREAGLSFDPERVQDAGLMIYDRSRQNVLAGGSGAASSAIVYYGHLVPEMADGRLRRVLLLATGALHSTLSVQQGESIPGIAHAVTLEREQV